jgi:hypothetical protein
MAIRLYYTASIFDSQVTDQTEGAKIYRRGEKKYEVAGKKLTTIYDRNTLFPRMFSQKPGTRSFTAMWSQMGPQESPTWLPTLAFLLAGRLPKCTPVTFCGTLLAALTKWTGKPRRVDGSWLSGLTLKRNYRLRLPKANYTTVLICRHYHWF